MGAAIAPSNDASIIAPNDGSRRMATAITIAAISKKNYYKMNKIALLFVMLVHVRVLILPHLLSYLPPVGRIKDPHQHVMWIILPRMKRVPPPITLNKLLRNYELNEMRMILVIVMIALTLPMMS